MAILKARGHLAHGTMEVVRRAIQVLLLFEKSDSLSLVNGQFRRPSRVRCRCRAALSCAHKDGMLTGRGMGRLIV